MKTRILLIILGLSTLFVSCRKDREIVQDPGTPKVMEDLKVPSEFNWKTTKDFGLTLTSPVAGIAEVTNSSGIAYQKAYLTAGMPYTMKLTLPAYETSVRLKLGNMSANLELSSTELQYTFQ
ncbi:MAG: hypothetical protein H3C41_11100 [Bacteroidales bacterium]|nr:hypothetical protein [Bacteroidales bacterium]